MNRFQIVLLILLLIATLFVRVYKIDKVPSGVYIDEADYGLQARSLLSNFRDYHGERSPFWVHSFNDVRTPIPAYFTALTTLIFKTPELQVRGPSVILGTLVVLIIFLLVKLWTKNLTAAFFSSAIFAFNPWQIQFSRFSHEGMSMMAIFLAAIFFFYKSLESKSYKFLLLSTILLSLTVYAYRTMSLFVPLTFVVLFLLYRKDMILFGLKKLAIIFFLIAAIILPFLYATTLRAPDQPRIAQLSITQDPEVPIFVVKDRGIDSKVFYDPTAVRKPVLSSYFFHNKLLSWFDTFRSNYLRTFSTDFLFIRGDKNPRHSVGKMGHLYVIDVIALIFGFIFLVKNFKIKAFWWLLVWLVISPIPSSLTLDGASHAARLFNFSAPLLLILGLGWFHFFESIKKLNWTKFIIFPILAGVWLLSFVFYLHRYFVHFPSDSAQYFGFGFKQATQKISEVESNYARIAMVSTKDPPMVYYLFWSRKDPKLIQQHGMNFSKDVFKNHPLDKYKVVDWPQVSDDPAPYLRKDTLYLVTQREFPFDLRYGEKPPHGVKVVDIITYPDKELAFYLVTQDPNYEDRPEFQKFKI